jgi:hypothetical protein
MAIFNSYVSLPEGKLQVNKYIPPLDPWGTVQSGLRTGHPHRGPSQGRSQRSRGILEASAWQRWYIYIIYIFTYVMGYNWYNWYQLIWYNEATIDLPNKILPTGRIFPHRPRYRDFGGWNILKHAKISSHVPRPFSWPRTRAVFLFIGAVLM